MSQSLLSATDVVVSVGERTLLAGVELAVHDDARIALVGPNGSGKSTLLRVLSGSLAPERGRIARARGVAVLHLPQLDEADDLRPVRATLHERLGIAAAAAELDGLAARLSEGDLDLVEAHAVALERWLALGGDDVDARLDRAAASVGLAPALLQRTAAQLSGGQRARAMLAAVTAARARVLLLDEPANHLDADGLARLRALLLARAGGLVLVAHDRALLGAVSNRVVELDPRTGTATTWAGGWEAYERERDAARRREEELHARAQAERARLLELETAARAQSAQGQRRARASGETDKHIRHRHGQSAQRREGAAARLHRRAERMVVPDRPWESRTARLDVGAVASGDRVLAAFDGAVLRRAAFALGPIDLELRDGDRVLLDGPNGSGKSTLLAALAGRLAPVTGRARVRDACEVAQARSRLLADDDGSLVATARRLAGLDEREARAALAAMGLSAEVVARPAGSLSPGERTRAELAVATAAGARLLLLDEPTNHLDIDALAALEAGLEGWPGALVVATHDVRLRDGLRLDRVLDVAGLR